MVSRLVWSLTAIYLLLQVLSLERRPTLPQPIDLAFWGAVLFALARQQVPMPLLGNVSLHFVGALATVFATGSPVAALLASLAFPRSGPLEPLREAFNRSQVGLASLGAYLAFVSLPPGLGVPVAGATYFLLNLGAMLALAWARKGLPPREAWRRNFAPFGATYLLLSPVAFLMARLYQNPVLGPWGGLDVSLVLLPVAYVRYVWLLRTRLEEATRRMLEAMVRSLEARDPHTALHSERMAAIALDIAREMGLPEPQRDVLLLGGKLHDIGKVGVPDAVLLKPGELSPEEWERMRAHPEIGLKILSPMLPFLGPIEDIVLHHHERWDGEGYPKGLRGEEIPLLARIAAVADAYEAMTADRPYRRGMEPGEALGILLEEAGKQFDPLVVEAFVRALRHAPPWERKETFAAQTKEEAVP